MNTLDCPLYRTRTVSELLLMISADSTELEKALAEVIDDMHCAETKDMEALHVQWRFEMREELMAELTRGMEP